MKQRNIPIEGDCDICGTPIPEPDIPRLYDRQSGNLTCDGCSKLAAVVRIDYEEQ